MGTTRETGDALTVEGEEVSELMFILEGVASVVSGGREIARLGVMDFVGEMSFVTGEPASATVVPEEAIRVHSWSGSELSMVHDLEPQVVEPLLTGINRDLAKKLGRANRKPV